MDPFTVKEGMVFGLRMTAWKLRLRPLAALAEDRICLRINKDLKMVEVIRPDGNIQQTTYNNAERNAVIPIAIDVGCGVLVISLRIVT
jgi:hypothetical protein